MVHSHSILAALLLPTLAFAAPQWRHGGKQSATSAVVSTSQVVDAAPKATPTPAVVPDTQPAESSVAVPVSSKAAPVSSKAAPVPVESAPVSSAAAPAPTPSGTVGGGGSGAGAVSFKNACSFDVTIAKVFDSACGGEVHRQDVIAGKSWSDTLENSQCDVGNVALKVYKVGETTPMHYEYGYKGGQSWYNLSFVNCVEGEDFSKCAGNNWSISGGGGTGACQAYQCSGYEDCCKLMGYCDPTATAAAQQPVGACVGDVTALDISMQVC